MTKFSQCCHVLCLTVQLMEGFGLESVHVCCIRFDFELTLHTLISITKLLEWNSNMKLLGGKFQLQVLCKLHGEIALAPPTSPPLTPHRKPGGKP